ncbi:MAG: TolC family protein [Leptospirillum sp.]
MSRLHVLPFSLFSGEKPSRGYSPSCSLRFPGASGSARFLFLWLFLSSAIQGAIPFWQDAIAPVWAAGRATVLPTDPVVSTNLPVFTLDQTVRLALRRNPDIAKERALVAQKTARSIEAGELPDPRLVVGEQYFPIGFNMGQSLLTMTTVGLRQSFFPWGKRGLLRQRAVQERKTSGWNLKDSEIRLVRDVRLAWIDLYGETRKEGMLSSLSSLWQKAFQAALTRYGQGTASESDLLLAQFQKDNLSDRQEALRAREKKSLHRLMRLARIARPFRIADEEPRIPPPLSESALLDRIDKHPALESRAAEDAAQAIGVQAAKKNTIPALSVEGDYSYFMGPSLITSTPNLFSVVLTMNLPVRPGERQDQKIREEERALESVEARHEALRQKLVEEIQNAEGDYRTLTRRTLFLERVLLPEATRNVDAALAGYATGSVRMDRVLGAIRKVEEIEIRSLALRADRMKAMTELSYLDGTLQGGSHER